MEAQQLLDYKRITHYWPGGLAPHLTARRREIKNMVTQLKALKKGDYFTKKDIPEPPEKQVWVRGDYDHSSRKYECSNFEDVNKTCFIKGDREVYIDFTF